MKKELIAELFEKFGRASNIVEAIECWSARELQQILNYSHWKNFLKVIDKAKKACENAGEKVSDHLAGIGKMVVLAVLHKGKSRTLHSPGMPAIS